MAYDILASGSQLPSLKLQVRGPPVQLVPPNTAEAMDGPGFGGVPNAPPFGSSSHTMFGAQGAAPRPRWGCTS